MGSIVCLDLSHWLLVSCSLFLFILCTFPLCVYVTLYLFIFILPIWAASRFKFMNTYCYKYLWCYCFVYQWLVLKNTFIYLKGSHDTGTWACTHTERERSKWLLSPLWSTSPTVKLSFWGNVFRSQTAWTHIMCILKLTS